MPPDRREEEIFAGALELPPDARPVYLAAVCAGDTALRARVEALLAAHDGPAGILDRPPAPVRGPAPLDGPGSPRRRRAAVVLVALAAAAGAAAVWAALR